MSEVSDYSWQALEQAVWIDNPDWNVTGMARIEGTVNGQKWAAIVPETVAKDEPAAKSFLQYLAKERR